MSRKDCHECAYQRGNLRTTCQEYFARCKSLEGKKTLSFKNRECLDLNRKIKEHALKWMGKRCWIYSSIRRENIADSSGGMTPRP